jgi:predicted heme/steroid binding protein
VQKQTGFLLLSVHFLFFYASYGGNMFTKNHAMIKWINRSLYFTAAAMLVAALVLGMVFHPVEASSHPNHQTYYQLNLSHIGCAYNQVEVHFVLLNVPYGTIPGSSLTFNLKINGGSTQTVSATRYGNTGNVWHYSYYGNVNGKYDVTSASVWVNGTNVNLHNPDDYKNDYQSCVPVPTTVTPIPTTVTPAPTTVTPVPTTETPVPTTETPVPTTETPVPTTETPVPTTETPVPTTETPVPTTETPVPTAETPVPTESTPVVPPTTLLQSLSITLDPFCTVNGQMQWTVENPNSVGFHFLSYTIDGGSPLGGFTAAPGSNLLTTTALGTHTVDILYGDGQHVSLTDTLAVCPLTIPVTGTGGLLIPVTGADQSQNLSHGLFYGGLSFAGFGILLSALRKFLNF